MGIGRGREGRGEGGDVKGDWSAVAGRSALDWRDHEASHR
jgi:hypothetical protein